MAKIFEGAIKLASTIQQTGAHPLDDRVVVAKVSDLYDSFGTAIYNGMLVAVAETGDVYMLKDKTKVGEAAGWKLIGGDTAADLTKVKEDVAKNKDAIGVINGTGDGSITKAVLDVKTELIGDDATADTIKHAEKLATDASAKVDTEIGRLNSTVHNGETATSAGDAASAQIKVTVEESKGKLTGVTVNAPSFESAGAADNVKTELLGKTGVPGNTIISAKEDAKAAKDAADNASKKVDTAIENLDGGGTSTVVKGVTITVNEIDGIVKTPAVSIADGTLTGAATDGNLVTGTVVKKYVDDKVSEINTAAGELGTRVTTLEGKVGSAAVEGGAAATGLFKAVADNKDAIAAEKSRATKAETALSDRVTTLEGTKHVDSLGGKTGAITVDGTGKGSYPVALTMTDQKLGATITGLGTAAAKAVGDFDAAGTADGVKTELVGEATEGYKTLGDLEAKIKDEALRADAAEKVNAKAISDETTRAKAAEKVNADAIAKINGTGEGSFAKGDVDTLASAKKYADEQIKTSVSSVYKVKGTKATYEALPTTGNVEGDVWNVTAAHGNTPAGTNYVWVAAVGEVAAHWDPLGGTIDLSPYAKSADVASTYATKSDLSTEQTRAEGKEKANADAIAAETTRATKAEEGLLGTNKDAATANTIYGAKAAAAAAASAATNVKTTVDAYTVNGKKISTKPVLDGTDILVGGEGDHTASTVSAAVEDLYTKAGSVAGNIDSKITAEIQKLDSEVSNTAANSGSAASTQIKVKVSEVDGKLSAVTVTAPSFESAGAADTVKTDLIGKTGVSGNTIISAKEDAAAAKTAADNASKKVDTEIGKLDVTGNISEAVKGVTVKVDETDGKVITPVVSIANGTIGGVSDTNLVTGDTVKTYVDTAITNAALGWTDIPATA